MGKNKEELSSLDYIIKLGNNLVPGSTFKLTDEDNPTNVKYWIPTGIYPLDVIISGIEDGGFPGGKIIEVSGKEATGKTMVAALAMKNAMSRGYTGIFIDTEHAVSQDFFELLGIDIDKMVYVQLDTVSEVCGFMEQMVQKLKQKNDNDKIFIVWDSVAQTSTEEEVKEDFDDYAPMALKARRLSQAFRKLVGPFNKLGVTLLMTNQLRSNIGASPWASQYVTPGGMAIPYACSLRIFLKRIGTIKTKDKEIIGAKIQATTEKNRITVPQRTVVFDFYFNKGIDNKGAMLDFLKNKGFIKVAGSWKKFKLNGEEITFQKDIEWYKLLKEKKVYDEIKNKVFEYSKKYSDLIGKDLMEKHEKVYEEDEKGDTEITTDPQIKENKKPQTDSKLSKKSEEEK